MPANKGAIMNGLVSYARFGNKTRSIILSNDELNSITADELVAIPHDPNNYS